MAFEWLCSLQSRLGHITIEVVTQRVLEQRPLLLHCQGELWVYSHDLFGIRSRLFIPAQLNIAGNQKEVSWDLVGIAG
jgi:hypothetical protein